MNNNNNVFSKKATKNQINASQKPLFDNTNELIGGFTSKEDEMDGDTKPLKGFSLLKKIYGNSQQEKEEEKGGKRTAKEIKKFIEASYNEKNPPKEIEGFLLDTELSNKTAKVYHNPTSGETVVAHRGTSGAKDWVNNVAYLTGNYEKTDRYKMGKKNQQKAEEKYGAENISTLGHSQGAVLARKLGADTKEIIGVNGASLGEKPLENEYNIRTSNDLVSHLMPKDEKTITIKSKTNNPLTEHSANNISAIKHQEIGVGGRRRALGYSCDDIDWINNDLYDDEMRGGDIFKKIGKSIKNSNKKLSKDFSKAATVVNPMTYVTKSGEKLMSGLGDVTHDYILPAVVSVGKPILDATAEAASTELTGSPVLGKVAVDALWNNMVAKKGADPRANQKSALLGKVSGVAGDVIADGVSAGMRRTQYKLGDETNEGHKIDSVEGFADDYINGLIYRNVFYPKDFIKLYNLAIQLLSHSGDFEKRFEELTSHLMGRVNNKVLPLNTNGRIKANEFADKIYSKQQQHQGTEARHQQRLQYLQQQLHEQQERTVQQERPVQPSGFAQRGSHAEIEKEKEKAKAEAIAKSHFPPPPPTPKEEGKGREEKDIKKKLQNLFKRTQVVPEGVALGVERAKKHAEKGYYHGTVSDLNKEFVKKAQQRRVELVGKGKGLTNKIVKHLDKDNKEMKKLFKAFKKHLDTEEATK